MALKKDQNIDAPPQASTAGSSNYSDPTYNVLQLVNAATKRLNDLAELERIKDEKINELNSIIMNLHVEYGEKLSIAESKRIDAIRAVDVGAVAIASERAAAQATVLANQVTQSAETLRTLVATTANTASQQFQQVTTQLMDRISLLEKSQYSIGGQGLGKTSANKDMFDIIKLVIAIAAFFIGYFVIKK